jgi:hypothetical protein
LERATESLPVPDEPKDVRAETRALLEESPEEGSRVIEDATFVSELLWERWGTDLEGAGMGYDRFVEIIRGYAAEFRLWVVGERPWNHCVAGLAGRSLRRLPATEATDFAEVEL